MHRKICRDDGKIIPNDKRQDVLNNLIISTSCKFRKDIDGDLDNFICILVGSTDAYHPVETKVNRQECKNCVESMDINRSIYSKGNSIERNIMKQFMKRWVKQDWKRIESGLQ